MSQYFPKIKYDHLILLGWFCILFGCHSEKEYFIELEPSITGVHFENTLVPTQELNILTYLYYYNGAGVAAGDYNNDGLIDLYFVGNQVSDKLYLNKGNFTFQDVTTVSGIKNEENWSTSVSQVDINQDGLLDLYICKIGAYRSIEGNNLLYVNQGIDENGIPHYKELSEAYGLDLVSFSTKALFFDYDLDNDLDLFLLNHSVHPNRSYGKGKKRQEFDNFSGDKLYRNDHGKFKDISHESGIYQGLIGYGLDASLGDLNNDGYPDIYVSNDFFENDYLYINQQNGKFKELITNDENVLGHTSHFSMGNLISDLNNDGWADIFELDMLPQKLATYKTSGNDDGYSIYNYYLKNGYAPQYMQNSLHMNNGKGTFGEQANLSGVAATDWSWSVLGADFDRDGYRDLFVTNGIKGATNDMDFISFIANDEIQRKLNEGPTDESLIFAEKLPEIKVTNYAYRNKGDAIFEDVTNNWFDAKPSFSNGAVYVDLDNDGDLDLVINNVNEPASIFKNEVAPEKKYIQFKFKGPYGNLFGEGAKVKVYAGRFSIAEENFTSNPYLSALPPVLTIGLDTVQVIDSVQVIWPGGKFETKKNLLVNQSIILDFEQAKGNYFKERKNSKTQKESYLIDFEHQEKTTLEFDREPLIPFGKGNEGPSVSVADVNQDGLEDVFISGAKWQSSRLFFQSDSGSFSPVQQELFDQDAKSEDVDHLFFDCDNDGDLDLIVIAAGNEFNVGKEVAPRLYLNNQGVFMKDSTQFTSLFVNASIVKSIDLENDGDQDLVIGSNTTPFEYGKVSRNYLLENNGKGQFLDITDSYARSFKQCGLVEDISVVDINGDGFEDLVVVGNWMPVSLFMNDGKSLSKRKSNLDESNGWWNAVKVYDFDKDGDQDIIAGNWGLNTRITASLKEPITLYRNDFDGNDKIDPIISYFYQGQQTTLATKDELTKQLPFLNKKYLSYESFANASLTELFGKQNLEDAEKKEVYQLASTYFENQGNNTFKQLTLPVEAQVSTVNTLTLKDFNKDGYMDVFLAGNAYEINTQLGRQDASHGTMLLNDGKGFFKSTIHQMNLDGPIRDIAPIKIGEKEYFIISKNNGKPLFLEN